jgi:hypothetical protein
MLLGEFIPHAARGVSCREVGRLQVVPRDVVGVFFGRGAAMAKPPGVRRARGRAGFVRGC